MKPSRVPSLRPTLWSSSYIAVIALLATSGFIRHSPWPILLAAVLTLPVSLVAMPSFYIVSAVLALIPGANPSSMSGSETTAADGRVLSHVVTGEPAVWYPIATGVLGVLALATAACINVLIFRAIAARRLAKAVEVAIIDLPSHS